MSERSISDTLFDLGVVHDRDSNTTTDGCHSLFYAGRNIGRYSAHEVANLMRANGLASDPMQEIAVELLGALDAVVAEHGGMQCSYPMRRAAEVSAKARALIQRDGKADQL